MQCEIFPNIIWREMAIIYQQFA